MAIATKKASIGYIKGLDILRFIAASGVIIHHTALHINKIQLPFLTTNLFSGAFFLNLFFVISGFLISAILFKEVDSGQFKLKNFFLRRVLRIWPMYFFVVILFIIILPLTDGVDISRIGHNVFYATFFVTNFQLLFANSYKTYIIIWSVCIEEHIYILFPFLLYALRKNKMALSLLLIVIGFLSWLYIPVLLGNLPTGYNPPYFFTTSYFYYFGMGSLLAVLIEKKEMLKRVNPVLLHPVMQGILLIAGFAFVFSPGFGRWSISVFLLFNGIFSCYLIYCAVNGKLLFDIFSEKVSRFLGNASYPMYLLHIKIIGLGISIIAGFALTPVLKYDLLLPLLVLSITIALSALAHLLIERPFLRLKKKYTLVSNK